MALAKHLTRIVLIGKLESYTYDPEKTSPGKGVIDIGKGQKARFTIWNNENGTNPHTKAADFDAAFKAGDNVFITGSDNRSYNDTKDVYYEDIQVWDFRKAEDDEAHRWVFVYVGDVVELEDGKFGLSYVDYRDKEMVFPILTSEKTALPSGLENGSRVKVKGELFSGLKMDYFGDGTYVTERNAVMVELLNTAAEVEEDKKPAAADGDMWD